MSKLNLSEKLTRYRTERPDEWTMDEFARDALKLEARVSELEQQLLEAADEIEDWGGYANPYFQDKHDLKGCIAKYRAAITPPKGNEI